MSTAGAHQPLPPRRRATAVAALAVVVVAVSGCNSGNGNAAAASRSPSAASRSPSRPVQPAGRQLAALLAADVPPGWTIVPGTSNQDSAFNPVPVAPLPFETSACVVSVSEQGMPDWWEPSSAGIGIVNNRGGGNSLQAHLNLAGFVPGDAVKALDLGTALVHRCHTFTEDGSDNTNDVTLTASTVPGLGDQNLYFTADDKATLDGQPVGTAAAELIVRVGNNLAEVDTDSADGMISFTQMKALAETLIRRLKSLCHPARFCRDH
jgi:hypothetical protein